MTIIRDLSPTKVGFVELLPEIIAGMGFVGLIFGFIVPIDDGPLGLFALRFIIGGGFLLISGILLAIERKIPSSTNQSTTK